MMLDIFYSGANMELKRLEDELKELQAKENKIKQRIAELKELEFQENYYAGFKEAVVKSQKQQQPILFILYEHYEIHYSNLNYLPVYVSFPADTNELPCDTDLKDMKWMIRSSEFFTVHEAATNKRLDHKEFNMEYFEQLLKLPTEISYSEIRNPQTDGDHHGAFGSGRWNLEAIIILSKAR